MEWPSVLNLLKFIPTATARRGAAGAAGFMPKIKVLVQYENDMDWTEVPMHRDPRAWEDVTRNICAVNVQGVTFEHADRYSVEPSRDTGGLYIWSEKIGQERNKWLCLPLAPDPELNGAINTIQFVEEWTEPLSWKTGMPIRQDQRSARRLMGWRDFNEHLPSEELDLSGQVADQREQGRFAPKMGTRTYYQSTTDAEEWHGALHDDSLTRLPTGSATETQNLNPLTEVVGFTWLTAAGEPGTSPNWPDGVYRFQLDATAAGANILYGFLDLMALGTHGHMSAVDVALTEVTNDVQQEAAFSGTGLKLATTAVPGNLQGPHAKTERFGGALDIRHAGAVGVQSLTLRMGTLDSFADGPWIAKTGRAPLALQGVGY